MCTARVVLAKGATEERPYWRNSKFLKLARLMSFDVSAFCSVTVMPTAGCKCKLPLYSSVLVRSGQEGMETAVWEEVSEKEAQKSSCSGSYIALRMCTCVLASESLAASVERALARLTELCLYHYMFNGTKQESSCCPPTPSSANKWQGYPCLTHRKGKWKPPPRLLCKGWNRLNPLGLNNLRKSPFYGNGCFHIFVLKTTEASHRVWVSVLVLAVHAGSKSQA